MIFQKLGKRLYILGGWHDCLGYIPLTHTGLYTGQTKKYLMTQACNTL